MATNGFAKGELKYKIIALKSTGLKQIVRRKPILTDSKILP